LVFYTFILIPGTGVFTKENDVRRTKLSEFVSGLPLHFVRNKRREILHETRDFLIVLEHLVSYQHLSLATDVLHDVEKPLEYWIKEYFPAFGHPPNNGDDNNQEEKEGKGIKMKVSEAAKKVSDITLSLVAFAIEQTEESW
jgi:hypothetical protein